MEDYLDYITPETDLSIINDFIDGITLFPNQMKATQESIINKKAIWTIEMGLGKTIITLGILALLAPKLKGKIVIVSAIPVTVMSFYEHIKERLPLKTVFSTGVKKEVDNAIQAIKSGECNCLVCTHAIWSSVDFNLFIYNNIDKVQCMVWDEFNGTLNNDALANYTEFSRLVPMVYQANATPIKLKPDVLYLLLRSCSALEDMSMRIFRRKYYTKMEKGLGADYLVKDNLIVQEFKKYFVNFNRNDVGATTTFKEFKFIHCEVTPYQQKLLDEGHPKSEVLYTLPNKNTPFHQIAAFNELLKEVAYVPEGENKITYCRRQEASIMLVNVFKAMNMPVMKLNGFETSKAQDKKYVEDEFARSRGTNLIMSVDVGANLNSANYVFIYETPSDVAQFIGRAARGYNPKTLSVYWFYYPAYESESLFKAAFECMGNTSQITNRDDTVYQIIKEEILKMYPNDVRIKKLR